MVLVTSPVDAATAGRRPRGGAGNDLSGQSAGTTYRVGWLAVAIAIVLAYLILVPVLFMLLSSMKPNGFVSDPGLTMANFGQVYTDPYVYRTFATPVHYAGASTTLAAAAGPVPPRLVGRPGPT